MPPQYLETPQTGLDGLVRVRFRTQIESMTTQLRTGNFGSYGSGVCSCLLQSNEGLKEGSTDKRRLIYTLI